VYRPHYLHMFDALLSRPRPWRFGHLYLPGGGAALGGAAAALEPGGGAPLVGVVMEVTRAVRLMDGKLLILATAAGRFKARCFRLERGGVE
jgi:Lon protease-like protein